MTTVSEGRMLLERDAIILANARRLIKANKSTSNGHLYMELFGTGFCTARARCSENFGLDPDSPKTDYNEMMEFIAHRFDTPNEMVGFKVAVTVTHKRDKLVPIWDRVHLGLTGDKDDLLNLQKQLDFVKQDVNQDMNKKGFALKDVDIYINFV